jgi:capsular exopolysaccharide synthesis family protein
MELFEYWKIIRKHIWLIILLMLVGASSTFYYIQQQETQYRTTTTLFLNPAAPSPLLPFAIEPANRVQTLANTYAEFMRTRSFAQLVSQQLAVPISEDEMRKWLTTQYVPDTQFFRITATHPDPQLAQNLANTAAQVLIAEHTTQQQQQQIAAQGSQEDRRQLEELQTALQNELPYYNNQIESLQSQLADLLRRPRTEETRARIASLRTDLQAFQSLRVQVLTSLAQTKATLATGNNNTPNIDTAVVVDAAPLPSTPLPRKTIELTLLGLVISLGLGVGAALLMEHLDPTVKTPDAINAIYGMPTRGVIGVVPDASEKGRLVALSSPASPAAEAFRALRTGVQIVHLNSGVQSLLITSAGRGEGRSFVAANLAISLAQNGLRVVLVDTDLRRPSQHEMFGLRRGPGFTDLVINPDTNHIDLLQPTEVKNLWLLPCGTIPPNPVELLSSPRSAEVMEQLKQHADIVIYDSPPAAMVTDAVVIARNVNAVLQVVRAGTTPIDLVLRCKAILEQAGGHVLGPILNGAAASDLGYYTYHGYNGNGLTSAQSGWRRLLPRRRKHENVVAAELSSATNESGAKANPDKKGTPETTGQ